MSGLFSVIRNRYAIVEIPGVGEIPDVRVLCEHSAAWMAVDSLDAVFVSICLLPCN